MAGEEKTDTMTCTQAQIDAAAKIIEGFDYAFRGNEFYKNVAKAALTAAAEAARNERYILTQEEFDAYLGDKEAATIERCAQTAEIAIPGHYACGVIAAAIRALKDKP